MSQFASEFILNEIVHQAGAQIPWRTIIEIMSKSKSHEEMLFYINATHKYGWSRSMLLIQFELKAYERSLIEPETTLENSLNKLGISKYKLLEELPEYLEKRLNWKKRSN